MRNVKQEIVEDYETGEYTIKHDNREDLYNKFINNKNNILPYSWGVWVTSYAMRNLHLLGATVSGTWLYSDTDSVYATAFNEDLVEKYNQMARAKLKANGYDPIIFNGKEFCLGVAEEDSIFSEFCTQGAKRYCKRTDKGLSITVAGVPKKGADVLNDNILNFAPGLIFPGTKTGKLTHSYYYVEDIYIDKWGNETGDSIDLTPCDYLLSSEGVKEFTDIEDLFIMQEFIQIYEESDS